MQVQPYQKINRYFFVECIIHLRFIREPIEDKLSLASKEQQYIDILENQQSHRNDACCHGRKKHFQWWRDKLISLEFLNQKISREWHEQGVGVQCSTCVLYSVYCTGVQVYRIEECAHVKLWKPLGRLSWCETRVTIASQRHRDVLSSDEDVSHNCQGLFMSWRKIYLDK